MEPKKKRLLVIGLSVAAAVAVLAGVLCGVLIRPGVGLDTVLRGSAGAASKDSARREQFIVGDPSLSSAELLVFSESPAAKAAQRLVYLPMVVANGDGTLEYGLAKSVQFAKDGRSATVELRTNAAFSDGAPVTADAVIQSYQRYVEQQRMLAGQLERVRTIEGVADYLNGSSGSISGLQAAGETTLQVRFDRVSADNMRALSAPVAKPSSGSSVWLGAGEYRISEMQENQQATLVRSPQAISKQYPYAEIVLRRIDSAEGALQSGSADLFFTGSDEVLEQARQAGWLSAYRLPEKNYAFVGLRPDREVLQSVQARQAVIQAVDRTALAEDLFSGGLAPQSLLGSGKAFSEAYPYDPAKAKKLWQQAGLESKQIVLMADSDAVSQSLAQTLGEMLEASGMRVLQRGTPEQSEESLWPDCDLYLSLTENGAHRSALEQFLELSGSTAAFESALLKQLGSNPLRAYEAEEAFFTGQAALLPLHTNYLHIVVAADCDEQQMLRLVW